MPEVYRYHWYNAEKTILFCDVNPAGWRWEDIYQSLYEQMTLMAEVEHTVHTIFSFNDIPHIPRQNVMHHMRHLISIHAPNEGLSVFVGTNMFFSYLMNTVGQVHGLRGIVGKFRFVNNVDHALREINHYEQREAQPN